MMACKKCKSERCKCDAPKPKKDGSKGSMPKPFPPKKPKK